jgi:nucleotide-binding universal stress UspA family protein
MVAIRTILVPTDFSAHSANAFRLACSLARDCGAQVVVLHVLTHPEVAYTEGVILPPPEAYEQRWREQLDRLQPPDRAVRLERRLVYGYPADKILRVAEETRCGLIVMGTHGWTGLTRLVMGSVAERVVRRAPCPVLTVKAPSRQVPPPEGDAPAEAGQAAEVAG